MRTPWWCIPLTLTLLCLLTVDARTHRLRAALTTVLFNEHTERIEVMHRFYLHDAEQLVSRILGEGADLLGSAEDRQQFGVYVHQHFHLWAPGGAPLTLELLGVELGGEWLWVYQKVRFPPQPLTGLVVSNDVLQDLWPEQTNTVNIERGGRVHTLTFQGARKRLEVSFPQN